MSGWTVKHEMLKVVTMLSMVIHIRQHTEHSRTVVPTIIEIWVCIDTYVQNYVVHTHTCTITRTIGSELHHRVQKLLFIDISTVGFKWWLTEPIVIGHLVATVTAVVHSVHSSIAFQTVREYMYLWLLGVWLERGPVASRRLGSLSRVVSKGRGDLILRRRL